MSETRVGNGWNLAAQDGVDGTDPLVAFLYTLMRDHLPTGVVQGLVTQAEKIGETSMKPEHLPAGRGVGFVGDGGEFPPMSVGVLRARYTNEELARMATRYARVLRR